jgi:hypothetical protein
MIKHQYQEALLVFALLLVFSIGISTPAFSFTGSIIIGMIFVTCLHFYTDFLKYPYKDFKIKPGDKVLIDFLGNRYEAEVIGISTESREIPEENSEPSFENVILYECKVSWRFTPIKTTKIYKKL